MCISKVHFIHRRKRWWWRCTSWQMKRDQFKATVSNNILFEERRSWNTAMLQSTSASSWDAGCWCGRTSSCGSWQHVGADGRNTWERTWLHYYIISTWPTPGSITRRLKRSGRSYLRQIIFSQLYFWASCLRDGSMMPPLRRSTRCRVDSDRNHKHQPNTHSNSRCHARERGCVFKDSAVFTHLSECCSLKACDRLPTVCQRKSDAAGQAGSLGTIKTC